MVIDVVSTYDNTYKKTLIDLRKSCIHHLAQQEDPKKILSFLNKCCVLGIDEKKQYVYIGVPNEFVLQQVRKFFAKGFKSTIHTIYNPHYGVEYVNYPDLQDGKHDLQVDIKALLPETKEALPTLEKLEKQANTKLSSYFGIIFQKEFQFSNFVVGASNQFAHSVAEAVANAPGTAYNPFFMYGGVGLGKTHLMQAIGNSIIQDFPEKVVVYLPTSKFIDHIIFAIRKNQLERLKEKLDEVDVLMLDDIQFLAGKDKTQEIFHTIFNDFTSKKKQVIVTSDQPPSKLTLLEARLQSRFSLGVVADLKAPDYETRMAILETKLKIKSEQLDQELIELIAKHVTANVRELEGALNIVMTKKKLLGQSIGAQHVMEALQTLGISLEATQQVPPNSIHGEKTSTQQGAVHIPHQSQSSSFEQIIAHASDYYGIDKEDLYTSKRNKEISFVRQLCMYIAKTKFHRSLQKIGEYFGGRNHASVIYAIKTFEVYMKKNPSEQQIITQKFL